MLSKFFSWSSNVSTSQKLIVVSVTAGVALLGFLAQYMKRRKSPRPVRRTRKFVGRRSRNSVRSPNDLISLPGSKASARSQSPGGSTVALSERLSLASGSLGGGLGGADGGPHSTAGSRMDGTAAGGHLSPQQLGVMGMEALETVCNHWEDALSLLQMPATPEESEFCLEIQNLLEGAWNLQEQSELLFLDQRSVLFRNESHAATRRGAGRDDLAGSSRHGSDPNFDSAESFASALDQVADLREFEEFVSLGAELQFPLYQSAIRHLEDAPIPYRTMRTELLNCGSDAEYLAKLHCIRLAFLYLFKDPNTRQWIADMGRQILTDILLLGDKDPKDFLVGYEDMMLYVQDPDNWQIIEQELQLRNVKSMTFYDVVLDFIILDAFKDLDAPPASVTAVVQNRFLSNGFKETALTTAVWSVLKAKRRMLRSSHGFMAHFYAIAEQISPLMAWGFLGPDESLRNVCNYFKEQTIEFLQEIFNCQECNYETVESLSADIHAAMQNKVENIRLKINLP